MRPSVLIDVRLIMESPTGIGRYLAHLVPRILERAPDIDFHLLRRAAPWPDAGVEGWVGGHVVHHVSTVRQMSLHQQIAVPRLAKALGVSLVHYPHYDAPTLVGGPPLVATIHDLKFFETRHAYRGRGRLKTAFARWAARRTVRRAARLIAVSEFTAGELAHHCRPRPGGIEVIHEGVDDAFRQVPEPVQAEARRTFGLTRPFVLSVGDRRPHKNHEGVVRAFAASGASVSHDLVIVGRSYRDHDGPERAAAETGVSVRFLEGIEDRLLAGLHASADLFVLLSRYEGFGLPVAEAMAAGTPVVTADASATREIGGEAVLRVPPDDAAAASAAIQRVLKDPALADDLKERGLVRSRCFDWGVAADRTLAVYRAALDKRPRDNE